MCFCLYKNTNPELTGYHDVVKGYNPVIMHWMDRLWSVRLNGVILDVLSSWESDEVTNVYGLG